MTCTDYGSPFHCGWCDRPRTPVAIEEAARFEVRWTCPRCSSVLPQHVDELPEHADSVTLRSGLIEMSLRAELDQSLYDARQAAQRLLSIYAEDPELELAAGGICAATLVTNHVGDAATVLWRFEEALKNHEPELSIT